MLLVTHDVEFAARTADRVLVLGDGGVLADGPVHEVLTARSSSPHRSIACCVTLCPASCTRTRSTGRYRSNDGRPDLEPRGARVSGGGRGNALGVGPRRPAGGRLGRRDLRLAWSPWSASRVAAYGARDSSAHELSLVAALAALATASRVLFASLPNVKPVTFIVLVSGVGARPGPGFMVGATAALVSNLFFGQGPWTPWQMLAWGAVGRGRRAASSAAAAAVPRRWELVVVGGVCGFSIRLVVTLWMFVAYTVHSVGGPRGALRPRAAVRPGARRRDRPVCWCFWPSGC